MLKSIASNNDLPTQEDFEEIKTDKVWERKVNLRRNKIVALNNNSKIDDTADDFEEN